MNYSQRRLKAVDLLAKAKCPIVITSSVGRSPGAVKALVDLAEKAGIEPAQISSF